jgi:hypothetical protein
MLIRVVLEHARVLVLDEESRVQDAVGRMLRRCADAARQGRGDAGPADEEEEEQQHNDDDDPTSGDPVVSLATTATSCSRWNSPSPPVRN